MNVARTVVPILLVGLAVAAPAWAGEDGHDAAPVQPTRARERYGQLPLHFEANRGQTDPRVRFLARGAGYALFLTPSESVLVLRGPKPAGKARTADVLRFRLVGADPQAPVQGIDELRGKANYLIGNDPSRWRTDVPLYARVRVDEVYPGVSLTHYGNQRRLEYDFAVAPGADPSVIRFRVEGAKSVRLDGEGNLVIRTRQGELVQEAPLVYQVRDGVRQPVPGRFRLRGKREFAFDVPAYDRRLALIIDPVVQWSVFLGGNNSDVAEAVALEVRSATETNAYVTGQTFSSNFPTKNLLQGDQPNDDAFVTKFKYTTAPLALDLDYSTYLGGSQSDHGHGIAVDTNSSAHVTGVTTSVDFPRSGGDVFRGGQDAFITKFNSTGNGLLYSRFLGGNGTDIGHDIALDGQNNAYVVGETSSTTSFPIVGTPVFQATLQGLSDAFFTKIDSDGSLTSPFAVFSTYLGGSSDEQAFGVALRDLGAPNVAAHVVGRTFSPDFPTKAPLLQAGRNGPNDAFVTTFQGSGAALTQGFGTYFGGSSSEKASAVKVVSGTPSFDGIYVAGETSSSDFPTRDAFQNTRRGTQDAFVSRIQLSGGLPLLYSTYLGGSSLDTANGIAVDQDGLAYVTGLTQSSDFPLFRELQTTLKGTSDAFLTSLVPTGCAVMYSTYWGGNSGDAGNDIAVTPTGAATLVGSTSSSTGFPVTLIPPLMGASHGVFQGPPDDGFVSSIADTASGDVQLTKIDSPDPVLQGQPLTYSLNLRNISPNAPAYGIRLTDTLPGSVSFVSVTPSANCSFGGGVVTCDFPCLAPSPGPGDFVDVVITVTPNASGTINNSANVTTQDPGEPTGNNTAGPISTTVNAAADLTVTKNVAPPYPTPVPVGGTVSYSITVTNNGPSLATGVQVIDTMPPGIFYTGFVGGVTCNPPPASVVTCTLSSPLVFPGNLTFQINGQATAPGVQTNQATPQANEADPDPGNDMDTADTLVTVPGSAVLFPTVRSSGAVASVDPANQNFLEWLNPGGPATQITIHRTTAPSGAPCPYETNSANLGTQLGAATRPFVANQKESFLDDNGGGGLTNFTTYCYTIFVDGSSPRFISGRPFDAVSFAARWSFNMGTWSMAPPGNGVGMMHAVSNDNVLYAMSKGASGGKWPGPAPQWLPYGFMNGPSQGRPSTYPLPVGTAPSAVFLSSQDGNAYAINAQLGGGASFAWAPSPLGTTALAHPSALFKAFGGAEDLIFVASRETPPTPSTFFGLRLSDGTTAAPGWSQSAGGKIGPVHGQPAVDYSTSPPKVYFATRALGAMPPDNNTLWCLNALTGAVLWAKPYGDIDAGVTLRSNRLYIATNSGTVQAVDTTTGDPAWTVSGPFAITPAAEGPAKGFIYAPPGGNELFFASKNRIWFLSDGPTSYVNNWPGGVSVDSPATPIKVPGETLLYVGSGDGTLQRRDAASGAFVDAYFLGDLKAAVGSPTFDIRNGFIYVGTEAGIIYAINKATAGEVCVPDCTGQPDFTRCNPPSCTSTCMGGLCF